MIKHTRACERAQGLSARAKALLMTLADKADAKGRVWAGLATLADIACTSPRTVRRAKQELIDAGWITCERRTRGNGARTSDIITVHDLAAAARNAARIMRQQGGDQLELPLMRVVHTALSPAGDNRQAKGPTWPLGQGAKLALRLAPHAGELVSGDSGLTHTHTHTNRPDSIDYRIDQLRGGGGLLPYDEGDSPPPDPVPRTRTGG